MRFAVVLILGACLALPLAAQKPIREVYGSSHNLAPFVASPQPVVDRMLDMASLKPGEKLYDLGCGDGRIVITAAKRFGANAVGIELSKRLVDTAAEQIRQADLTSHAKVVQGNLLEADLSDADVVTIYLETGSNELLRPKLEKQLKPGARVVSHDFEVRGWQPTKVDKIHAYNRNHVIYLYLLPQAKK
jgi:protein-L-isoaspartate O-methyltransferase